MEKNKCCNNKFILGLIVFGTFLASAKMVLFGYNQDEEYQLVMSYRLLIGDKLFSQIWEPHQTSAIFCTVPMWMYRKIAGSFDGVVIFMRVIGLIIQGGISSFLYLELTKHFSIEKSFILAAIYFNISPKLFALPDFSNLQFWFVTLLLMCAYKGLFEKDTVDKKWVVLMSLCLCGAVLSYPSMIILGPILFVSLIALFPSEKRYVAWIVLGVCGFVGMVYSVIHITQVGIETFLYTIKMIPSSDLTHSAYTTIWGASKLSANLHDVVLCLAVLAAIFASMFLAERLIPHKEIDKTSMYLLLLVCLMAVSSLILWLAFGAGYEAGLIYVVALFFVTIKLLRKTSIQKFYIIAMLVSFSSIISTAMLTDMSFISTLGHGTVMSFVTMLAITDWGEKEKKYAVVQPILIIWCLFLIFSKGFMARGGNTVNNITCVENVVRKGPAKGVFTEYMRAYIMDANFDDWNNYINDGDRVLIVTETIMSDITTNYLLKDVEICHYSVINPAAYNEHLLDYWGRYPEKMPNVIVVDSWFGTPLFASDSWIMNYIDGRAFNQVIDGQYLRFYRD